MTQAVTASLIRWPDLEAALAALMACVGSPVRLALRLIARVESRDLRQRIRKLEDQTRERLSPLIANLAAYPPIAELCTHTLNVRAAARAERQALGQAQTGKTPAPTPATSSSRATYAAPPAFRYLVTAPQSRQPSGDVSPVRAAPRILRRAAPALLSGPGSSPQSVSALPLARRLAAVARVIENPEEAAFNILRRNPQLGVAPPVPANADHAPLHLPRNRHERRAQKKKMQLRLRTASQQAPRPGGRVSARTPRPGAIGAKRSTAREAPTDTS